MWTADVEDKRALLRTMPLTFMDTVVLLHLRRELITSNPNERTIVDEDEVMEATLPYQPSTGTDRTSQQKKFLGSWNKMKKHSIVIKTPTEGRWEVSPVLRILFSAEEIAAVTRSYEAILEGNSATDEESETSESDSSREGREDWKAPAARDAGGVARGGQVQSGQPAGQASSLRPLKNEQNDQGVQMQVDLLDLVSSAQQTAKDVDQDGVSSDE